MNGLPVVVLYCSSGSVFRDPLFYGFFFVFCFYKCTISTGTFENIALCQDFDILRSNGALLTNYNGASTEM